MMTTGKLNLPKTQLAALTICAAAVLLPFAIPISAFAFDDDLDKNAKPLPPYDASAVNSASPAAAKEPQSNSTATTAATDTSDMTANDRASDATSTTVMPAAKEPASGDSKDWQTYKDSSGSYSMQYPTGWPVKSNPDTGRIDVVDTNNCELTILPFATAATNLDPLAFFNLFIKTYAPAEKWSKPVSAGSNAYKAYYANDAKVATAALVLYPSAKGTTGKVCLTSAPRAVAQAQLDTFARIMSSFTAGTARKLPAAAAYRQAMPPNAMSAQQTPNMISGMPAFRTFTDPSQHSFTMEVPVGWTVQGGLYRPVAIDARPWVTAVSPDKMCTIWVGDASIPPYTLPTATGISLGYYPGKAYNGGIIAYYNPANKYIVQYGKKQLSRFAKNIRLETVQNYPDIAKQLNPGASSCAAASAKFSGMYGDIPMISYLFCSTKETIMYDTGMWWVSQIGGVACAADRDMLGLAIFLHMSGSFKFDPSWFSDSVATAGAISRQTAINAQIRENAMMNSYWRQQAANDANHAAYWDRQRVQDQAANNFSDYLRNQTNMVDPATGNTYKVDCGPQYHYIDPSGSTIIGSDSPYAPANWQQLLAPPR